MFSIDARMAYNAEQERERVTQTRRRERDQETINTPRDCSRCREDRCPLGREKVKVVKILGLFGHAKLASRGASRE